MTDPTHDTRDQQTAQRIVTQLDAEVAAINAVERARLAAARHRAIERLQTRPRHFQAWHGAAVSAALALAVLIPLLQTGSEPEADGARVVAAPGGTDTLFGDLPLLATTEDVDFYRDLEFLMWLETQDENAT